MQVFEFLFVFVPTILFIAIVMPMWLFMHYRYKNRVHASLNADDQSSLDELLRTLDQLNDRVAALESILDERSPNWRRQTD
ncbi:phage shock protein B [Saccharospirillum sp. MSK14-1]|uniref:envelope stress response membrane protein PspB n=1 Tax=Saccharospirillum sp. MSK14-1 TaxID=1897632 RepID=UPI000D3D53A7|nr:envelope stress response membrane protein PspB [Saccharospirillum sp. MSK14-1]PTY37738.1 phage shock protein B [Saccharospirillum sp. MSK14-1]